MADITIYDAGFARYTNLGTQWTRANGGSPITLKSVDFSIGLSVNVDSNPPVGFVDETTALFKWFDSNFTSIGALKLQLSGVIDKTDSTAMGLIPRLIEMSRSLGYKILYYDTVTSAMQSKELVYQLSKTGVGGTAVGTAHVDSGSNYSSYETTYPHIHVRFSGEVTFKQDPNSKFVRFSLPLVMIE